MLKFINWFWIDKHHYIYTHSRYISLVCSSIMTYFIMYPIRRNNSWNSIGFHDPVARIDASSSAILSRWLNENKSVDKYWAARLSIEAWYYQPDDSCAQEVDTISVLNDPTTSRTRVRNHSEVVCTAWQEYYRFRARTKFCHT